MSEIKIINAKKIYHDVPVIENLDVSLPFLDLQVVEKRLFFA